MNTKKIPVESEDVIHWGIKEYNNLISEKEKDLENELFTSIGLKAKKRGYLYKEEFIKIGTWKTSRQLNNYRKNSEERIQEILALSFTPERSEEIRIEILTLLKGVGLPVASAILTIVFPDKYGVIDVRAWRILHEWGKVRKRKLNEVKIRNWIEYKNILENMARKYRVRPRDIDMALYAIVKRINSRILRSHE